MTDEAQPQVAQPAQPTVADVLQQQLQQQGAAPVAEPQPQVAQPAPVAEPQPQAPAPVAEQPQAAPVQMPGAASQGAVTMPAQPVAAPEIERPKNVPENWPEPGYDGPQPWEVEEPPDLTHDRGLVTSGAAGAVVTELAACLAHLGIGTAISQGTNPHMIYGPTEVAAVAEFRRIFGVEEDPAIVRAAGETVVGPWTWEALFRAVRKAAA